MLAEPYIVLLVWFLPARDHAELNFPSSFPPSSFRLLLFCAGEYIADELNALALRTSADEAAWATLTATPDAAGLGKRLGPAFKKVRWVGFLLACVQ